MMTYKIKWAGQTPSDGYVVLNKNMQWEPITKTQIARLLKMGNTIWMNPRG